MRRLFTILVLARFPKARLEPVLSGATVTEGDKIERLKEVRIQNRTGP